MARKKPQRDKDLSPEALLAAMHSIADEEGLEAVSFSRIASELGTSPSGLFAYVEGARQPARDRAGLSRRLVVEAALRIADEEGLDALTLRRLGGRLDVTPVALYRYVESKDDLLDAIADHVLGLIAIPDDRAPWQEFLRRIAHSARTVLSQHPRTAPLYSARPLLFGENARVLAEEIVGSFLEAGVSRDDAVRLYEQFARLTLALTLLEAVPQAGQATDTDPEAQEDAQRRFRAELENLSPRRFPALVEVASALAKRPDPREAFERGLDLVIAGLESQVQASKAPKRGRRSSRAGKSAGNRKAGRSRGGSTSSSTKPPRKG